MSKLLIVIIGALTLGAILPALAGPDFQAIERARKARQATQAERRGDTSEAQAGTSSKAPSCPIGKLVLPLDHGPRAQTTPAQNKLRKERHEAQLKACNEKA